MSIVESTRIETWKPVVGFEGRYEVSDCGRVKGLLGGKHRNGSETIMSIVNDGYGYPAVRLTGEKTASKRRVHTLVMEAFVGPRQPGMETNHKDGCKTNNHLSNLEYCTHMENMRHAFAMGLNFPIDNRAGRNVRAKLTERQVREIRTLRGLRTQRSIASDYGVSETTIYNIWSGRKWASV